MANNTVPTKQFQKNDMSMSNFQTFKESAFKVGLSPGRFAWFITILSLGIVLPSLTALVSPSCDEGSLQLKAWGFEYQLTKKGSCNSRSEITRN